MTKSLEEVYRSVHIPRKLPPLRKLLAFLGPGFLISVGYMDPGNWATDIAGGSQFGYQLLFVVLLSNLMAMVLQHLSLKLGVATGKDLAQVCHDQYGKRLRFALWILAEIAITACDLAEVIGSAIALELLFGLPIMVGVLITSLDVFILLLLQKRGQRPLEFLIVGLVAIIFGSFLMEILWSHPNVAAILQGALPSKEIATNPGMLYLAIGILGATVMPHNLYLHSALVQTRKFGNGIKDKITAVRYATLDSNIALLAASGVNAAILIVSAAAFHANGHHQVAEIQDAHQLLAPILGNTWAPIVFATALLASGHSSTITGTLAGQVVMEGFIDLHIAPWKRRLITRAAAIIPAIIVIGLYGEGALAQLLVFSQVVLSLQLPFAVVPLILFTSNHRIMDQLANSRALVVLASVIGFIIIALNALLIGQVIGIG